MNRFEVSYTDALASGTVFSWFTLATSNEELIR